MKQLTSIFLLIILLSTTGCKKSTSSGVPLVNVNITIYVTQPSYSKLNSVGGWAYVSGGYAGILVYRASTDQFIAYDRDCTYQPTDGCAVVVNTTNILAVDNSCCGSQFSIVDGSVTKGPAAAPLKMYTTNFDGVSALQITN